MRSLISTDLWRRWSVAVLGTLLCGVVISTIIITNIEWTVTYHLQFVIPLLLALGLVAYGIWLARCELSTERITRIAMWSLAGTVVISLFATWEMYLHLAEGAPFAETLHELLLGGTEGAIVGGFVGYYDVQRFEQLQETKRAQKAISEAVDGVALLDEEGRYTEINQAHANMYGYDDPDTFLGESWRICYTDDKVAEFEERILPVVETDGQWRGEAIGKRRDGTSFPQELTLTALEDGGLVCVVRDVSDRRQREQELKRKTDLLDKTQRMADVGGWELDLRDDELYWTDQIHRIYELPLDYEPELESVLEFFHTDDVSHLEDAVERAIEDGESYDRELRLITANDNLRWVRALGEPRQENGETVIIRGAFQDITERKTHENRLKALHSITREFLAADTVEEITTNLVSVAQNMLGCPLTVVWEYDADADQLVPLSVADPAHQFAEKAGLQELPALKPGSAEMKIFRNDETVLIEDYGELENRQATEIPLGAVLFIPMGDHGLITIGSPEPGAIDATERFLGEILASNARAAIDRLEREQELERQLDRMDFFNSILRHDVLNGMTVIRGRAEFLTDELDGDQLRDAEAILDWCDDIIDIVQRVRTTLDTLTDDGSIQIEPIELTGTLQQELGRIRETYPEATFETAIPDSVHVQGNGLLSDVFGNIITNAVDHNETDGLCVSITATERKVDNRAIVRVADNGKGVPDEAKETIFRRDETGHAKSSGSGFGLFFVDAMVKKYGGDVRVENNEAGGATFVIELPLTKATTPA